MSETKNSHTDTQSLVPEILDKLAQIETSGTSDIKDLKDDVERLSDRLEKRTENIQKNSRDVDKLKVQVESLTSRMNSVESNIDSLHKISQESATNKSKLVEQIIILFVGGFISSILGQLIH